MYLLYIKNIISKNFKIFYIYTNILLNKYIIIILILILLKKNYFYYILI